ncbi:mannose-1-phosphate guanylyltransferase/mannose-6-phosphate isomerase [Rhodophyticola sp.]|uniref:mannose-1-phosphate guanylyltransferase/mannose-6-phosphate isomerase n=1 Tax=Rhodophyticola sp. TaxID=2680032 RepID=UPI003D2AC04D
MRALFQASARRLSGGSDAVRFNPPLILTNADFRFIVTEQLHEVGIDPVAILIEPEGRNTAPAILAAALHAQAEDPDAILLVAPSDHVVPDVAAFHAAVAQGLGPVAAGDLVTFGITPAHAETAYGYLELAEAPQDAPVKLHRFVEKPDARTAADMLAAGTYLWNAGIFLFRAADIIAAFHTHAPDLVAPVTDALERAKPDLGFLRLDPKAWAGAQDISVDYAVMERAANLSVVPFAGGMVGSGWLGCGLARKRPRRGAAWWLARTPPLIDCTDTLLRAEDTGQQIVGIGLSNIMAVAMGDAVLVADMSRAQDVKRAVAALKEQGAPQATQFPKDHRPWGWFESLAVGARFQVKRILVHPGASLSLQSHFHRSEHWIVVQGTAKVTVDDTVQLLSENQSVYIPLGAVHRLENPGKLPMVLIEVQTGGYVGEDDIVRYEDAYQRG